jgi:hypothetical protein
MNNPLRTADDYELFIYEIKERFQSVQRSTLAFVRRGSALARVAGELHFGTDVRLVVRERIVYDRQPAVIDSYGYEVWKGSEKLYWYDSQPHPDEQNLKSSHPHHKHIQPDMKHHRIPAPLMSFGSPNLPELIREISESL